MTPLPSTAGTQELEQRRERLPFPVPSLRSALIVLLSAALVSACGFRPRGSITLPEDFASVYVQAPIEISDELAIFLDSGGATVTKSRKDADAVIRVQSENYEQRVTSVDATTGKALRMKDGTTLVPSERLVVRRIYVFDPTAVIGATRNVNALRVDMRRDAAERIIRLTEAALTP